MLFFVTNVKESLSCVLPSVKVLGLIFLQEMKIFRFFFFRVATTFLKKHEFYPHFHLLEEKKKIRAKIVKH